MSPLFTSLGVSAGQIIESAYQAAFRHDFSCRYVDEKSPAWFSGGWDGVCGDRLLIVFI